MQRVWLLSGLGFRFASPQASAVESNWIAVGEPGNRCDMQSQACFGSVADVYQIGQNETTNGHDTGFPNAVAETNTNSLYKPEHASRQLPRHHAQWQGPHLCPVGHEYARENVT